MRSTEVQRDEASSIRANMASGEVAEDTPLLRSEHAGSGPSSAHTPEDEELDIANQSVTKRRAVAIILSVYTLIFLQGTYCTVLPISN